MENTNKKCRLFITWHWNVKDGEDATIMLDEVYANLDAAFDQMDTIMPDIYSVDDGTEIEEWNNEEEPWTTFVANVDCGHYILARIEPVD